MSDRNLEQRINVKSCVKIGESASEILAQLKNGVFWDVAPCGSWKNWSSDETSVFPRATRRNIPEDTILHSHRRENLNSYIAELSLACCEYAMKKSSVFEWHIRFVEGEEVCKMTQELGRLKRKGNVQIQTENKPCLA
jgi:hypothetical protein